mmetsp:Transcript_48015/g.133986  ORF Transcript_48015/g.133986 Transcript_48015/m.133986 type:complete len:347 (+) Transcript_48015:443-1483(+)
MFDEFLAEGMAPPREAHGLLQTDPREAHRLHSHHKALVIEIDHGVAEAFTLATHKVGRRDAHAVEFYEGGVRHPPALSLHPTEADAGHVPLHKEQTHAGVARRLRVGAAKNQEVIGLHATCDPLLRPADGVEVAVTHRAGAHRRHVGATRRLRDAETQRFPARDDVAHNFLLHGLAAVHEYGRYADARRPRAEQRCHQATGGAACQLVQNDELKERVYLDVRPERMPIAFASCWRRTPIGARRHRSIDASLVRLGAETLRREIPGFVPLVHVWHQLALHEVPAVRPPEAVVLAVEWRELPLQLRRLGEWHLGPEGFWGSPRSSCLRHGWRARLGRLGLAGHTQGHG